MKSANAIALVSTISLCLQSLYAAAAEEFQDAMPIEVAEALFGFGVGGNLQVYSGVLEEFPDFEMPDQFEPLGTSDRNSALTLALVTPLNEEDARTAILAAFEAEGWIEMPRFEAPRQEFGFISPNAPEPPSFRQLCHDDLGQLTVSYRDRGGRNFMTLSSGSLFGGDYRTCAERIEQSQRAQAMRPPMGAGMYEYIPLLEVPEEAKQGRMPFIRGGGGRSSGNTAETETTFILAWELEEVYRHFAEQIVEQGWTLDVESIGSLTATGTWIQQIENNRNLVLRLNVVNSADDRFDLTLSVEGPGGRSGSGVFFGN